MYESLSRTAEKQERLPMQTVASALAGSLHNAGIDTVFGLPGGETVELLDAIRRLRHPLRTDPSRDRSRIHGGRLVASRTARRLLDDPRPWRRQCRRRRIPRLSRPLARSRHHSTEARTRCSLPTHTRYWTYMRSIGPSPRRRSNLDANNAIGNPNTPCISCSQYGLDQSIYS